MASEYYSIISENSFKEECLNVIPIADNIQSIIERRNKKIDYISIRSKSKYFPNRPVPPRIEIETEVMISGEMPKSQSHFKLSRMHFIEIVSIPDEWFVVSNEIKYMNSEYWNKRKKEPIYYKCDQVEGLLKLLQNLDIIN